MRMHSFDVYDKLIDECMLRDHVHLDVDYVSSPRRDLYFKAADVIVLPYRKIFQSGVLLMALRYKLPVIMTDLPPNAEFVKDYLCAKLFKANDEKDLHEKISELLVDQVQQDQLITIGLQKLEKEHAPEKVAATIIHSISK
jgi:glycosyltransferase involved in cell wall biosynthesis